VNVPSVLFIELALDSFDTLGVKFMMDEIREFRKLPSESLDKLIEELPITWKDNTAGYTDIERGYLLGLQTANMMLLSFFKYESLKK
jgi:hypothetical protein